MPFTGKELGYKILEEQKLNNVSINAIKQLDHYNPLDKHPQKKESILV